MANKKAKARGERPPPKRTQASNRSDAFIKEYLVDLNATQAAIRAGYSPLSARFQGATLLAKPDVQAKVAQAMVERANRTGISADRVLERMWGIATADARDLVDLIRGCCRYCWGTDNRYQRTPREMAEARAAHAREQSEQKEGAPSLPPFDEAGGLGWNPKNDPNPKCPECFGDGVVDVRPKDTRDLSPQARLLYAGVKQSQFGIEVKTHSQTEMLVNCGKHLGLFRDRVELTGKDGKDLQPGVVIVPAKVVRAPDPPPAQEAPATAPRKAAPFKITAKR